MSETLTLAKQLLAQSSITPEDHGCQDILAKRLEKIGFTIQHFPFHSVKNLWAKKGFTKPVFCFAGHTDVVPPGDLSLWDTPPFEPTLIHNNLYARGAADMKSSLAAMVVACERFYSKYPEHPVSIAFLITSDEEGPAKNGTQAVLKILHQQQEIPQWCLVGEASSTEKLGDTIKIGRRGSLTGHLILHGIQGHVAYPQFAKNPIHLSFKPLQAIIEHVWDLGDDFFPATTLQFSNISAGTGANNVIPSILKADFNLRFSPQSHPQTISQTIKDILTSHQCDYELTWEIGGKPFFTSPTTKLIETVCKTITNEFGYAPLLSTGGGTSDGRFFAEYGCEVVEVGPNNKTIHQVNECINIEELEQLTLLYEKILINLLF